MKQPKIIDTFETYQVAISSLHCTPSHEASHHEYKHKAGRRVLLLSGGLNLGTLRAASDLVLPATFATLPRVLTGLCTITFPTAMEFGRLVLLQLVSCTPMVFCNIPAASSNGPRPGASPLARL